jgi:plastocyanin
MIRQLFLLLIASLPSNVNAGTTKVVNVTIKDLTFTPKVIHVQAGTMVTWTNQDDVAHTVTSGVAQDDGKWVSSPLIVYAKSFSVVFKDIGTFPYFCKPHYYNPNMHGTVVVSP